MNFLSVLCVVLCVRFGAFMHTQNNAPDIRYQNEEAIQVSAHRNNDIPINNPYDDEFRNQPIGSFREQFKPKNIRFESQQNPSEYVNPRQIKNTNEHLLNEENYTGNRGHYFQDQAHPDYINPTVRRLNKGQYNPREYISKPMLQENTRSESSRISPHYLNWKEIKNTNEHLINQESNNSQRVQHFQTQPDYILPETKRFNEVHRNPGENIFRNKLQFSDIHEPVRHNVLPQRPIDTGSVFTGSKNIISQPIKHLIEATHMPEEDTTLELQAVSPEYIKSFIKEDKTELTKLPLTSPYEKVNSAETVKYSDNKQFHSKNYFEQDQATYENPSAEVLYSTKRALPYKIEEQQIPYITQGGNFDNNDNGRRNQDNLKLMQPSKRYMIIHPDGRVEHVDEIEKVTNIHPNYVMIKSQDFLKQIQGKSGISGLQIPQLYANNLHEAIVNKKRSEAPHHPTDIPSGQKSSPQFVNNPLYTKITDSEGKLLVFNGPKVYPTQVKAIKVNSHMSPENSDDENQLLNTENTESHLLPEIENLEENNHIRNEQTIRQLTPYAKENEFENIESTSVTPSDIQQIQYKNEKEISAYNSALLASSTIATITEKNNDNLNKTVITKLNKTEKATSPFVNLTLNYNLPIPPHDRQITLNNESRQYNSNTLLEPKVSMTTAKISTDNNIKNKSQTAPLNTNETDIGAIQLQNSTGTMFNRTVPTITQVFYKNPEILPDINLEISDTLSTTIRPESGVISPNSTATSVSIPNKTLLPSNDQEENTNKNVTNIMPALNITSPSTTPLSNTENTTNNTGFWFRADEQFWQNIMSNNDTQNLFYFFFVPPKTNIMQKETKTTLYPNGTTVEEVSETIDEDGVPRVIKTTNVFVNSTTTNA